MNMILKERLANRRERAGVTLVEVIVVLVILAILAAIAIPALTGYFDKAKYAEMDARFRTQITATQALLSEWYGEYGGFGGHLDKLYTDHGVTASIATGVAIDGSVIDLGFRVIVGGPDVDSNEYNQLTGDSYTCSHGYIDVIVDHSGTIQRFLYQDRAYFNGGTVKNNVHYLEFRYLKDIDSPTAYNWLVKDWPQFPDVQTAKEFGFKSGLNIIERSTSQAYYNSIKFVR
ncbi:MAG: prepilin-type N-terminal cleavage/methylation domain-containing protein [Clostridiales Family XIII bacterium]|jgi:prepilin-type N-terminal cleavage/methylation domain-containing protein|nr:prepilin-type N-terminal cleavage/methylation domain-containing protein [Clostridiales Family XIII bacterium]